MIFPAVCWAQEAAPPARFANPGLAPGDQVLVHMYDFADLGGGVNARIAPNGTVRLPYAGTIQAAGMSPDAFQIAVADALRDRGIVKNPNVTVEIVSAVNLTVQLSGPGVSSKSIPLYAPAPLSYVLIQAGGLNGYAAHHLTIIHPDDEMPTSLDYDPDSPDRAVLQTVVRPGDLVHVASRGVYFVVGEVGRPGIYPIGGALSIGQVNASSGIGVVKQLTLLEVLAQVGGVTAIAARSKMRILRTVDGKREEIMVDEVKLYKGEVADPIIHPNDIIFVPTSYIRQQTNNLFSTALSGLYAATQIKSITD